MNTISKRYKSITTIGQWKHRQSTDKYVHQRSKFNYRSRSAFKLHDLDQKHTFLLPTHTVLDLGGSPGGWAQVIKNIVTAGRVVTVDILAIEDIEGVIALKGDLMDPAVVASILVVLDGKADVVTSDMAPSFTGTRSVDVSRVNDLVLLALSICERVLVNGGTFVAKFLDGEDEGLKGVVEARFTRVWYVKPKATRNESTERYLIAKGFKLK